MFGKKEEVIKVSEKHVPLRIAGFILALAVAIVSFSYALTHMGIHEEGYYDVEAAPDNEAVNYASGMVFNYHITGNNANEMRQLYKNVSAEYSTVLKRAYKLLDNENLYDGYINIAYINEHQGEKITVSDELFYVLSNAYVLTLTNHGFNMFAGPLYKEWESIIYSEDSLNYDPLNNENEEERIREIAELVNDFSNFEFSFNKADNTITYKVSDEYIKRAKELEIDVPALDLNLMKHAYMLELIRRDLTDNGYTNGVLLSNRGLLSGYYTLMVNMEKTDIHYPVYIYDEGKITEAENPYVTKDSCFAAFRAFPMDENDLSAYIITDSDGKQHLRNMFFNVKTGFHSDFYKTHCCFAPVDGIVNAAFSNLVYSSVASIEELSDLSIYDFPGNHLMY